MFIDISDSIGDRLNILFDYNIPTNDWLEVASFERQAEILQNEIDKLLSRWFKQIDIITHSQWSVAATLINSNHIWKAIFIAPPRNLNLDKMNAIFWERPWIKKYPDWRLKKIPRRDGSITTISMEYWESRERLDMIDLYEKFTKKVPTHIILAQNDEILWSDNSNKFTRNIKSQKIIPGNHDFTNKDERNNLIEVIKEIIYI